MRRGRPDVGVAAGNVWVIRPLARQQAGGGGCHAAAAAGAAQAPCGASPAQQEGKAQRADARQGCTTVTGAGLPRSRCRTCRPGLLLPSGPWLLVLLIGLKASKAGTTVSQQGALNCRPHAFASSLPSGFARNSTCWFRHACQDAWQPASGCSPALQQVRHPSAHTSSCLCLLVNACLIPARSWRPAAARLGASAPPASLRPAAAAARRSMTTEDTSSKHHGGVVEEIPPTVHQTAASAPGQPEVLFRPDLGSHTQVGIGFEGACAGRLAWAALPRNCFPAPARLPKPVPSEILSRAVPLPFPNRARAPVRVYLSVRSCHSPTSPSRTMKPSARRSRLPRSLTTRCRRICRPTGAPTR